MRFKDTRPVWYMCYIDWKSLRWILVKSLKLKFFEDFEVDIWWSFWGLSLVKILKLNFDQLLIWPKITYFGESTQSLGPLCIWQCLENFPYTHSVAPLFSQAFENRVIKLEFWKVFFNFFEWMILMKIFGSIDWIFF